MWQQHESGKQLTCSPQSALFLPYTLAAALGSIDTLPRKFRVVKSMHIDIQPNT
jgi:hypothetical protein